MASAASAAAAQAEQQREPREPLLPPLHPRLPWLLHLLPRPGETVAQTCLQTSGSALVQQARTELHPLDLRMDPNHLP